MTLQLEEELVEFVAPCVDVDDFPGEQKHVYEFTASTDSTRPTRQGKAKQSDARRTLDRVLWQLESDFLFPVRN